MTDEALNGRAAPGPARPEVMVDHFERRRGFSRREQMRLLVPLFVMWALGFSCLAGVALHGDVGELLLDPSWVGGAAWYAGVISQLGAVAWSVAAVTAFCSAWLARTSGRQQAARFLAFGGVVSFVLLADDLFGLHSGVLEQIGIPKIMGELIILGPLALWVARYRTDLLRTRYQILVASFVANGLSIVVDTVVSPGRFDFATIFEDGPKFLGILAWATYFVVTSRDIAKSVLRVRDLRSASMPETSSFRTAIEPAEGRAEVPTLAESARG